MDPERETKMSDIDLEWKELEALQDQYNDAMLKFYQLRYKYWSALHNIKKASPLTITYKQFESRVRQDCKKRQRLGQYGKRPRGTHLDHFYYPVMWFFVQGINDFDIINSTLNCKWMPRKDNIKKGIRLAIASDAGYNSIEQETVYGSCEKYRQNKNNIRTR